MEQSGGPQPGPGAPPGPRGPHTKRLKELENAALQSTLTSRADAGAGAVTEPRPGEGERPPAGAASPPRGDGGAPEGDAGGDVAKERTLTDHLNKRLLSSFLEKLNQTDLALPGVQRLDCAVADEDSNRAADEW